MTKEKGFDKDPSWKGVIKWGGLSLFVSGLVPIIFVLSIFITQQTMPVPAKEALENPALQTNLFLLAAIGVAATARGAGTLFLFEGCQKEPHVYGYRIVVVGCTHVPCLPWPNHIPLPNKR